MKAVCVYGRDLLLLDDVAVVAQAFPTANLQVIWEMDSYTDFGQITVALKLLERSPNLFELEIKAENMPSSRWIDKDDKDAASRINQDLKMLKTIFKIGSFSRSILDMDMHITIAFFRFLNRAGAMY
ncbi:uncharacterized protein LOC116024013 [Ipomoea triloba]|uniref:uncharacterized protein LOC116024013 n=1 Tax=Ipomoea triloba TaxID=35885 RepID=UPI00125CDE9B|nr:uncharacterized protein LOC116024013 [Ipomoea triloba]XP_031120764.1 uncharacterized protein LOC116024013 [Ipomoea triloba]XP_031120765.1 uncharacterized protein LOC116024013 [Ipomoea triloba]